LPHSTATYVVAGVAAASTTLIGVWATGDHARYLRFWAWRVFFITRLLAFALHFGIGLLATKLATVAGWIPVHEPSLFFLNGLIFAGAGEAAYRADWAGLWVEPADDSYSLVRGMDRGLIAIANDRARGAVRRFADNLGQTAAVAEATRLLSGKFTRSPNEPVGKAAWGELRENVQVVQALGPEAAVRTPTQEMDYWGAMTAIRNIVRGRIEADDAIH
jgi:hypothetical protein